MSYTLRWDDVKLGMKYDLKLTDVAYETWLEPLELVDFSDGIMTLEHRAHNPAIDHYIARNMAAACAKAFGEHLDEELVVKIIIHDDEEGQLDIIQEDEAWNNGLVTPDRIREAVDKDINVNHIYSYKGKYMQTSYPDINYYLNGGLSRGELYIVGAHKGMGKTVTAINFANDFAIDRKRTVVYVSLKDSVRTIMRRSAEILGKINTKKDALSKEEYLKQIEEVFVRYIGKKFYANQGMDQGLFSLDDISKICEGKAEPIDLLIIDDIEQLEELYEKKINDEVMKLFTDRLHELAKEYNCAVMLLTNLEDIPKSQESYMNFFLYKEYCKYFENIWFLHRGLGELWPAGDEEIALEVAKRPRHREVTICLIYVRSTQRIKNFGDMEN